MNVLLINGSPKERRSNTYRLSSAFLEGLKLQTDLEVREVCALKLDIKPCLGCFACWNKTPGKCCMSDDMASVLENMLWADVILWSFPLYYFSVPGGLKNLIDRQLPMNLPFMSADSESGGHPSRYDLSNKHHVVISTCGFYTAQGNYDGVDAMFTHMCGKGNYTSIYCGQGELFRVKELSARTDEYLSWVRDAGAEFARGGITAQTREKLSTLLYPRKVFEAMADASWGIEQGGETSDESLVFTRQMAALYNSSAWSGKDLVLEMNYTDLGKRYQILLSKDGSKVISEDFVTATTIIETSYTLWKAIAAGEEDGQQALMAHKYRVRGDFSLMIHWDRYFGAEVPEPEMSEDKKSNMLLMLLPWILFWSLPSMLPAWGPVISVYASVVIPLLFRKFRMVIYDHISAACVTACALLVLLGMDLDVMRSVSYLCFGTMWTIGAWLPIPLTAHYSIHDYAPGMMNNPIFIKTNRILTLCWGVLYLILSGLSLLSLRFPVLEALEAVNLLAPAVMSIVTLWFPKWYPAHVARGN